MHFFFSPDAATKAGWKSFPVRIRGTRLSKCHKETTLLVKSKSRGYVSQNCSTCGQLDTITFEEIRELALWVSCPECRREMTLQQLSEIKGEKLASANYGYSCSYCLHYLLLADLLPEWDDIMPKDLVI